MLPQREVPQYGLEVRHSKSQHRCQHVPFPSRDVPRYSTSSSALLPVLTAAVLGELLAGAFNYVIDHKAMLFGLSNRPSLTHCLISSNLEAFVTACNVYKISPTSYRVERLESIGSHISTACSECYYTSTFCV